MCVQKCIKREYTLKISNKLNEIKCVTKSKNNFKYIKNTKLREKKYIELIGCLFYFGSMK